MSYEDELRRVEKSFRPKSQFKHEEVIDELANVAKEADYELSDLKKTYDKVMIGVFIFGGGFGFLVGAAVRVLV